MNADRRSVETIIACRNLQVQRGARTVLEIDALTICSDESVAIIGPNGSGKSTLVLTLMGLLRPQRGTVTTQNTMTGNMSPRDRARQFAYVPQAVAGVPELTVAAVVAGGRYIFQRGLRAQDHSGGTQIAEALDQCNVAHLRNRMFRSLSVGERQKVLLAAAIAQDARMLVLDEPNASLDPGFEAALARILIAWREKNRGFILVTHNIPLVSALAPRVIGMREGRVVSDGAAEEVLTAALLEKLFDTDFVAYSAAGRDALLLPNWQG